MNNKEYNEIMDNSNFMIDSANPYDMKIKEALEKQIPKVIKHPGCFDNNGTWHTWNGIDGVPYDLCPICEVNLCTTGMFGRKKMNYCPNCGQALKWK